MVTVDAKGFSCPQPMIMAQEALKKNPDEVVVVEVDNASARDNVARCARRAKRTAAVEEKDGYFTITFA